MKGVNKSSIPNGVLPLGQFNEVCGMRILLMTMMMAVTTSAMAIDFTWDAEWGYVAATCPDDKFAGKLRVDFLPKVEEFEADEAAGNCIAYVVVNDAQDSEDGWLYNEANFEAMAIAMDSYDATYFAMTGERIEVTLEVHRSAEDGYLVYNQREGDLEAQLKVLLERESEFATAEADIRFYERTIETLQGMIKGLNDAVDMDLYVELNTAKASLAEKESQLLALGTTVANLEIDKSALQDDIVRVSADLAAMANAKAASDMLVGSLTTELNAMTLERDNGLVVAANLRVARDSAMAQVVTRTNELNAMTVLKDAAEARIVTLDHDLTSMTVLHDLADAEVTRLDAELVVMTDLKGATVADLAAMTGKRDAAVLLADGYLADVNSLTSALAAMTSDRDAKVVIGQRLAGERDVAMAEVLTLTNDLTTMTSLRDAAQAQVTTLVADMAIVANDRDAAIRASDDWYNQFTGEQAKVVTLTNENGTLTADLLAMTGKRDAAVTNADAYLNDLNAARADKGQLEIDLAAKTRESDDWYNQLTAMTGLRDAAVNDKAQLVIDLAAKTRESDDWYNQLTAMTALRDAAVAGNSQLTIDLAAKTREADDWYSQFVAMTGLRDAQVAIVVVRDAKIVDLKADLVHEWDLYDELVASSQQTIDKQACKIGAWETFDSGGRTGTAKLNTDLQACAAMPGVG